MWDAAGRPSPPIGSVPELELLRFAAAGSIALVLHTGSAAAGEVVGGVRAGAAIPHAPAVFSDAWRTGFGVTVGAGFRPGPWIEYLASFSLDRFPVGDEARRNEALLPGRDLDGASVTGGDTSVLLLQGELRVYLPISLSWTSVYVLGGAGFLRRSFEELTIASGGAEETVAPGARSALAASAGGGVELRLTRDLWLALESAYTAGLTGDDEIRYLPVRAGLAFR
jgi:opacity protein-like surface antigen